MKEQIAKLYGRLQQFPSAGVRVAKEFLLLVFGQVAWSPPGWLKKSCTKTAEFTRVHPHITAAIVFGTFALASAGALTWRWYQTRPRPHYVTVNVAPIPVTKLEKDLKFPPLVISFSESAARLQDLKKPVSGVRLEPAQPGTWRWTDDSTLVFQPTADWPAAQKFRIIFEKDFFPAHVRLETRTYETETPTFRLTIKQLEFYQDPTNPTQQQATATIELTHEVEPGELEKKIELTMLGGSQIFASSDPAPHFTLSYGLHRRIAYLRSSFVRLPEQEDFLKLTVKKEVRTAQGGARTQEQVESKLRIPSIATMFRIDNTEGTIARNKNGEPEQIIVLTTTADISTRDLAKSLEIRLLPPRKEETTENDTSENSDSSDTADGSSDNADNSSDTSDQDSSNTTDSGDQHKWQSVSDVPPEILDQAKIVEFTALPTEKAQDRQHAFRLRVESKGELYVRIRKGVRAQGDYPLTEDYNAIVPVPELPREVQIQGDGGLLALSGERKLSIRSRGVSVIEYEIARVATAQINHLVSQTTGDFQRLEFRVPYFFNEENISRIALEHQSIALENKWKANYSAFDFSQYLRKPADGGSERGLFFLTARAWDPEKKKAIDSISDQRFLLITDLGILSKKNADGSHDVYVMSIKTGKPVGNVTVDLLGKNGIALQTATTDESGHCSFAAVEKSNREKSPVAFVARNGDDVSFMPYGRDDRLLNFSRFDIEGVENSQPENLDAYVFTERGVYRPGDEIHIAFAVKQRNWTGNLKGLLVETEVVDARDLKVQTRKIALPETGFTELSYQTAAESPTGLYRINVYLIKNRIRSTLLGSTTVQVKEFLPDRMKIQAELSAPAPRGWINPRDIHAFVTLTNLYGTPATERRITAKLELAPTAFRFSEFPGFLFYDPAADDNKERHDQSVDLGEKKTDDKGRTEFDLQLERFADATYAMQFITQGFEAEGGRSVTTDITQQVSALPYVVGCKSSGDLNYIGTGTERSVDLIAIDPQLNRIALEDITLNVIVQEYVSVLAKQENGDYAYQSVLKERPVKSQKISVSATGTRYVLPTNEPGNFIFELRDDQNRRLAKIRFCVTGQGAVSRSLEKNAELEVKLDRKQYKSGDDIAISITAPYSGSGLITIERDHVYAHTWFQSTTTTSVQHIRVPDDFEGSGYINVAFVRGLDSKEIFASPLSYGVVPFTANMEKRRLQIDLQTPAKVEPGTALHIRYKSDHPAKIVIFAVDQGILQVTNYKTPDPLGFFFRKCALSVQTSQIVDLILPEFSILRSMSAFGGDGNAQRLNPFKRITDKPVVFWSGIIDTDATEREVVYDVPDYFDGTLRVMAVALSRDNTGSAERDALVRGPFVITPSTPVLAAPGDEFETGVTVANNVEGSRADAEIELRAETSEHLSIVGAANQKLVIPEGREKSAIFRVHVNDKLGSAEIRFVARRNEIQSRRRATLSIRPPVPYLTEVRGGSFNKESTDLTITRSIHPEFRKLIAVVSGTPLGLAQGLDAYLKEFPHGCSEQITSGAFCRLLLSDEADFGLSKADVNKQVEYIFGVLRRRQSNDGSFGYWAPETAERISFVSAYVMDFLEEAKSAGFPPPPEMLASGSRYLQKMAGMEPQSLSDARTIAYAIYVLTREGVITTNYILNLRDYLEKNQQHAWQNDITGVYIAGALHLLHQDAEAEKLIAKYTLEKQSERFCDDFYQPLGTDSQYIAVLAREFPARLKKISASQFARILKPINDGGFNTLSAAYAVRALKAYSHAFSQNPPQLSISEIHADKTETTLTNGSNTRQRHEFSGNATALRFRSSRPVSGPGVFFQVIEAGFDRNVPTKPLTNGLEVFREILDKDNNPATRTHLGESLRVRLHIRSLKPSVVTNVALTDLLPGGFEIIDSSLHAGVPGITGVDYVDIREDRAVFFVTAPNYVLDVDYQIKSCNRGEFVVPPVFAESMYDRNVKGCGVGGHITVTE